MAYEKRTIKHFIEQINARKMYLPAIQRKYVWEDNQITRLMDSILLGYPIGTFLLWKVNKRVVNEKEYSMYEFIKDFHQRDRYKNESAPQPFTVTNDDDSLWAVLDGQQRLTSLYIALQGSMSRKLPNKHWKNDEAFPKKELYFNLHSKKNTIDDDITYEFKFLTEKDAQTKNENYLWYLVKDVLKYTQPELVTKIFVPNGWLDDDLAMENLSLLHSKMTSDEIMNYFEVADDSIDNVLDIFVRINSGGTILSKTDLLFSTIVSHWDHGREKIDNLLTYINKTGEGYSFTNDHIMRACLYLLDMSISLKVETFKRESVLKIKNNWDSIEKAIKETVSLLNELGFNSENIISYVAIMPIMYYRFKGGNFDPSSKNEIKKYFVTAHLKQIFSSSTNNGLTSIREVLKQHLKEPFRLKNLVNIRFTSDRNLKLTAEEIEGIFDTYEIGAYTFLILTILYPNFKYGQKSFHQDHMHPHSGFEEANIKNLVLPDGTIIDDEKKELWRRRRNTLANLQLLESKENLTKNDLPLTEWLKKSTNKENAKYLPKGESTDLSNFENFMIKRQELMYKTLKDKLL